MRIQSSVGLFMQDRLFSSFQILNDVLLKYYVVLRIYIEIA